MKQNKWDGEKKNPQNNNSINKAKEVYLKNIGGGVIDPSIQAA